MTTGTDDHPFKTEVIERQFLGDPPHDMLRTVPHEVGKELFTDNPIRVYVDLGRRQKGSFDPAFRGGGYITISDWTGTDDPSYAIDVSEETAKRLVLALADAIGELHKARKMLEAQV